ncbi:MAG: pyrimidine reductase family protein [Acidimicrobiia bacterium]|nr:pyrimidine reductase family protein [Acidimicrobiia bacterium]MYB73439.1 pyrimidine reductase family protein [Acidimicrobiia bacterium]MYH98508.1 pyrimidine reductase family protein [Acidimicrobiia bacterium]
MDQLFPRFVSDVDPVALYASDSRIPHPDRPWLMLNMVTSADGATSADGVSASLSSPVDRRVFAAIRSVADVVVVAAETVRREGYGPPKSSPEAAADRATRNQAPRPRLAVVSRSLDLDFTAPVFGDSPPPLLFTVTEPPADRLAQAEVVAEVHRMGADRVDLTAAMARIGELGAAVVLAEGGPTLNGQLLDAGLLDEVCWTISPVLAGGDSSRMAKGAPARLQQLRLDRVLAQDHTLFLRYLAH